MMRKDGSRAKAHVKEEKTLMGWGGRLPKTLVVTGGEDRRGVRRFT